MNPAALWLTKTCLTFPMEITKEGAQSLNAKCPVVFERSYSYLRLYLLAARLPELTSKLESRTRLLALVDLRAQEQAFNWLLSGERWYRIAEVQFVEMTGAVATKQASVTPLYVILVNFYKNKAPHHKQRQLVFSVVVLLLKYNFYLRNKSVINSAVFHRRIR